ncbi:hypothetical protein DFH28DRAFT_971788 [Melampsora americana]|nr:hypothetical protein DFH28DRAFT_971788 [Melampsora americana]
MRTLNFFILVMMMISLISRGICHSFANENELKLRSELEPLSASHLPLARDQTEEIIMESESDENLNYKNERNNEIVQEVKTPEIKKQDFKKPINNSLKENADLSMSEHEKILIEKNLKEIFSKQRYNSNPIIRLKTIVRNRLFRNPSGIKDQRVSEENLKDRKVILPDQELQKERYTQPMGDEFKTEETIPNQYHKEPEAEVTKESNPDVKKRKISIWEAIRRFLTPDRYFFKFLRKMWSNWFKHLSGGKNKTKSTTKKVPVTVKFFKNEHPSKSNYKEERKFEKLPKIDLTEIKIKEKLENEYIHSSKTTLKQKGSLSEKEEENLQSQELKREEELGPALRFLGFKPPRKTDLNQEKKDELVPSNHIQYLPPSPSFSTSSKDLKPMIQSTKSYPDPTSPTFKPILHPTEITAEATSPILEHIEPIVLSKEILQEPKLLSLEETYALIHPTESDPNPAPTTLKKVKTQHQLSESKEESKSSSSTLHSPEPLPSPQEGEKVFKNLEENPPLVLKEDPKETLKRVYKGYKGEWDYLKTRKSTNPLKFSSSSSSMNSKESKQTIKNHSLRRTSSKKQFLMRSSKQLKLFKKFKTQTHFQI